MDFAPASDQRDAPSPIAIFACEVGGGYQIGWSDDAPSFPSRSFAEAVAISSLLEDRSRHLQAVAVKCSPKEQATPQVAR
jgi:hypothetical protein